MNLNDLLPNYLSERYSNQIVAIEYTSYDGDFQCHSLEPGCEFEFYKMVMEKQMGLWENGRQIDTSGCSISIEESVLNFVTDLKLRKTLVEYLAKDSPYWQARITGKNPHVKHEINFKELGLI